MFVRLKKLILNRKYQAFLNLLNTIESDDISHDLCQTIVTLDASSNVLVVPGLSAKRLMEVGDWECDPVLVRLFVDFNMLTFIKFAARKMGVESIVCDNYQEFVVHYRILVKRNIPQQVWQGVFVQMRERNPHPIINDDKVVEILSSLGDSRMLA